MRPKRSSFAAMNGLRLLVFGFNDPVTRGVVPAIAQSEQVQHVHWVTNLAGEALARLPASPPSVG